MFLTEEMIKDSIKILISHNIYIYIYTIVDLISENGFHNDPMCRGDIYTWQILIPLKCCNFFN